MQSNLTLTDLANLGLALVCKNLIASLEDSTFEARSAKLFLTQSIREVLGSHSWFTPSKEVPVQLTQENANRWVFPLPADFVRVLWFDDNHNDFAYRIDGSNMVFLTDRVPTKLTYLQDWSASDFDLSRVPPVLLEAVYVRLAAKLCYILTGDIQREQNLNTRADVVLNQAKATVHANLGGVEQFNRNNIFRNDPTEAWRNGLNPGGVSLV